MAVDRRRMVAMGGGGFGTPPGDPALDAYVLGAAGKDHPRICLLPTASGDPEEQIRRFHRRFRDLACEATHVSLFRLGTSRVDLPELLLGQDVIYVGGGSMLNLLAIWKVHGIDVLLRTAWERGVVLSGLSAGSMCWFEAGVTTSHGPPRPVRGLGWLPGSNSVHYHGEPERRPCFRAAVQEGSVPPGWGVDDGVALLFAGTELVEAVSAAALGRVAGRARGGGAARDAARGRDARPRTRPARRLGLHRRAPRGPPGAERGAEPAGPPHRRGPGLKRGPRRHAWRLAPPGLSPPRRRAPTCRPRRARGRRPRGSRPGGRRTRCRG